MKDLDQIDQDAREFVALLKSSEARHFLLKKLFAPMAIISAAMRTMPIWRFGADCVVRIPLFLFVCLFVLFRIELLAWTLRTSKSYSRKYRTSG